MNKIIITGMLLSGFMMNAQSNTEFALDEELSYYTSKIETTIDRFKITTHESIELELDRIEKILKRRGQSNPRDKARIIVFGALTKSNVKVYSVEEIIAMN